MASDTSYPVYQHYGTNAERLAFTPSPPASGQPIYIWYETDTGKTFLYDTSWHQISGTGADTIAISAGASSENASGVTFSNSNGVSFGISAGTITASVAAGGGALTNIKISAGASSELGSAFTFSNSNGISAGLSAGTITFSHNGLTSQSNQAFSAQGGSSAFQTLSFNNANGLTFSNVGGAVQASYTVPTVTNSSWTLSNTATSVTVGRLAFSDSNGITFGLSTSNNGNHTLTASYTVPNVPAQTNQTLGIYISSNTSYQSSSSTYDARSLTIVASDNITAGWSNSSLIFKAAAGGAGGSFNISAGTTSNNLTNLVFSDSNGVTFGLNGSTVTASVNAAGGATLSQFTNIPFVGASNTTSFTSNRMIVQPFIMPQNISGSYLRALISINGTAYTLAGTSANTTFTVGQSLTFGMVVFSRGTGASSLSLMSHTSASIPLIGQTVIQNGAQGSQFTVGYTITYPIAGGTSSVTSSVGQSTASYSYNSNVITGITGPKYLDIPFTFSLSPGNYYLGLGTSTTSGTTGGPAGQLSGIRTSGIVGSQVTLQPDDMGGGATAFGIGGSLFSTNVQFFTTAAIAISQMTTFGNQGFIYFQINRFA